MECATHVRVLMFAASLSLYEAIRVKYFISYLAASGEKVVTGLFVLPLLFVGREIHPLRRSFLPVRRTVYGSIGHCCLD
jgi:hypothetical protein